MFSFLSSKDPSEANLYIDLGTAHTLIVTKKEGLILNEPSIIAYTQPKPGQQKPIAAGYEALELVKNSPGNIFIRYPLKEGVVADIQNTEAMIRFFLNKPEVKKHLSSPKIIISIPYDATEVERRGTEQIAKSAGAKHVFLVEEPLVAALGANLDVGSPEGRMIIDFGGGTTEISIIALNDIIFCQSLRAGGHRFNEAIIQGFKTKHNLVLSPGQAEQIKIKYGSAIPRSLIETFDIEGRDLETGKPKTISSSSQELSLTFDHLLTQVSQGIFQAIENAPPEIVGDIMEHGIFLVGGGSLLKNLPQRLSNEVQIQVKISQNPLTAIADGGKALLNNTQLLENILI